MVGLLLSLGLATAAYWSRGIEIEQRGIAEQERDRAAESFRVAEQTTQRLVFDTVKGLETVQGLNSQAVLKILDTANIGFQQLVRSAPENMEIRRTYAAMLDQFGHTYMRIGEFEAAEKAYHSAIQVRLTVHLGISPDKVSVLPDIAASYENLGDALQRQGKLMEAIDAYLIGQNSARVKESDLRRCIKRQAVC